MLIEAVSEDFELKVRLLTELSARVRENALIATSTSCLRVGDLAKHVTKPERFTRLQLTAVALEKVGTLVS